MCLNFFFFFPWYLLIVLVLGFFLRPESFICCMQKYLRSGAFQPPSPADGQVSEQGMGLFWPLESSRTAKGTSTARVGFQGFYQSSEVPDLQALVREKFTRGAKLPQKIVLQLEGSL